MRYYISTNKLTNPVSYSARVPRMKRVNLDQIVQRIADRSTLTDSDVHATVLGFLRVIQSELAQGSHVVIDGLATFYPSIRGRLASEDDPLPEDATVQVNVRVHPKLVRIVRAEIQLERIDPPNLSPDVRSVRVVNGSLTALAANTVMKIYGRRLAFDRTKPDEGVYLKNTANSTVVKCTQIESLTPTRIEVVVPSGLTPGATYELQVRARNTRSRILRTGIWNGTLTAASGGGTP